MRTLVSHWSRTLRASLQVVSAALGAPAFAAIARPEAPRNPIICFHVAVSRVYLLLRQHHRKQPQRRPTSRIRRPQTAAPLHSSRTRSPRQGSGPCSTPRVRATQMSARTIATTTVVCASLLRRAHRRSTAPAPLYSLLWQLRHQPPSSSSFQLRHPQTLAQPRSLKTR